MYRKPKQVKPSSVFHVPKTTTSEAIECNRYFPAGVRHELTCQHSALSRYRVNTGTGWTGVSILRLGGEESLIGKFYLIVATHKFV